MSHHFDSAAALDDERINPCDLYAFPAGPDTTALVVTVNPDAGRSSQQHFGPTRPTDSSWPTTLAPARTSPFGLPSPSPTTTGSNRFGCSAPAAPPPPTARKGQCWARAAPVRRSPSAATGWPGAGLAADPFSGDGVALGKFLQDLTEGRYTAEGFTAPPSNLFDQDEISQVMATQPVCS